MADSHSTSKQFSGRAAKSKIQTAARRVLGPGNLASLCERAAAHFGVHWDGHKGSGYSLLKRIIALEPGAPRPEKKQRVKSTFIYHAPKPPAVDPTADDFLTSYAWRSLRMRVLVNLGARCGCCGATAKDGKRIHVDHIKPRRQFPELALVESNLQVLCEDCNHGKGNWDQTDWRDPDVLANYEPIWRRVN